MVQLQEIIDEHFQEGQPGPEEDDGDYTDTGMSRETRQHTIHIFLLTSLTHVFFFQIPRSLMSPSMIPATRHLLSVCMPYAI